MLMPCTSKSGMFLGIIFASSAALASPDNINAETNKPTILSIRIRPPSENLFLGVATLRPGAVHGQAGDKVFGTLNLYCHRETVTNRQDCREQAGRAVQQAVEFLDCLSRGIGRIA